MIIWAFIVAALRTSVPYILPSLAGVWSERAGVVNLTLEGLLIVSAFGASAGAYFGESELGAVAGIVAAVLLAALYGFLTVTLGADQIVCGVAINLLADGGSRFLLKAWFNSAANSPHIAAFSDGNRLSYALMLITAVAVYGSHLALYRSAFGLRVQAVGDFPQAAASVGVRPRRVRFFALMLGGALAGLGGTWLAIDQRQFVAGMAGGRGYIAIAAVVFSAWRPWQAALAALAFASAEALQVNLQIAHLSLLPTWLISMFPYLLAIVALASRRRQNGVPLALGQASDI